MTVTVLLFTRALNFINLLQSANDRTCSLCYKQHSVEHYNSFHLKKGVFDKGKFYTACLVWALHTGPTSGRCGYHQE
jgi:hypothetical protein